MCFRSSSNGVSEQLAFADFLSLNAASKPPCQPDFIELEGEAVDPSVAVDENCEPPLESSRLDEETCDSDDLAADMAPAPGDGHLEMATETSSLGNELEDGEWTEHDIASANAPEHADAAQGLLRPMEQLVAPAQYGHAAIVQTRGPIALPIQGIGPNGAMSNDMPAERDAANLGKSDDKVLQHKTLTHEVSAETKPTPASAKTLGEVSAPTLRQTPPAWAKMLDGTELGKKTQVLELTGISLQGTPPSVGAVPPSSVATPPPAGQIAAQILESRPTQHGQETEILLDPEELGRVRMKFLQSDGQLTLIVTAERSETHDLLRRHMHELATQMKNLGFDRLEMSLSDGSQQQQQRRPSADQHSDSLFVALEGAEINQTTPTRGRHAVDLRL